MTRPLLRHKINAARDRAAWRMANFILRTIGTKKYRDVLRMTITTGMATMDVLATAKPVRGPYAPMEELPDERI